MVVNHYHKTHFSAQLNDFSHLSVVMTTEINAFDSHNAQKEAAEFKSMCPGYKPLMTTIPAKNGQRIIAIGDTHGDWKTTLELLKISNIISLDSRGDPHWSASPPDTIVVQLGDQIDRCRPGKLPCAHKDATADDEASDIDIINMFTRLDIEARKVGGAVYSLLGNHELMNVSGDFRYVSRKNLEFDAHISESNSTKSKKTKEIGLREYNNKYNDNIDSTNSDHDITKGEAARKSKFAPGGSLAKELACTRSSLLIIGGTLFAHAGVVPGLLKALPNTSADPIKALTMFNQSVRKWLLGQVNIHNVTSIINSMKISPFWNRILGKIPNGVDKNDPLCHEHLIPVFKALQIGRMVIGHTPQLQSSQGNTTCGDSLVRIDIGSSQAFQGIDGFGKRERPIRVAEIIVGGDVRIISK